MDSDRLEQILTRFDSVKRSGAGYSARCPAHEDNVSSLSLSNGDDVGIVLRCHAGCSVQDVVAALGMTMADLAGTPHVVAEYPYHDGDGRVLYTVERWANPKSFKVRPGLPDIAHRVVFALQWVSYARDTGQTLYVVEGEKDALTLINLGIPATCNVGGAGVGKWYPHYSDQLAGCQVIVVADNDEPGKAHARAVAHALGSTAKSVALAVPGFGKDMTDLLTAGYPLEHLLPLEEDQPLPVVTSATVRPRRVEWVWPGYIPLGKLTTVEGDPGGGKSTLTIDLVARWSTGKSMPDGVAHNGPYASLMISAEDDPEDTIVPRLIAAGADLHKVHLLSSGAVPDLPFNLGDDLAALTSTIINLGVRILILDPLASFLPDGTDSHSDHRIRRALYPLHLLARRTNIAVVAVRHLSKSATKAVHAGNGSIGIIAAARAAFLVGPVPGDDPMARALAPIKCNLAAEPPALRYRIQVDPRHTVGSVIWDGAVEFSAQDVLDGERGQTERMARDDARDYLHELCDNAPMTWKEITSRARADGYAEITLRRVRNSVVVKRINPIMPGGERMPGTYWIRADQVDTFSDSFARLLNAEGHRAESKRANAEQIASESDLDDAQALAAEEALSLRERLCDICLSPDASVYPRPHLVIRCPAHDPRLWSPP